MYPPSDQKLTYETEDSIYFYTSPFLPLENFSPHAVEIWGRHFMTAEHAYHWRKFERTEPGLAEKIFNAGSPELGWRLSRTCDNQRSGWLEIRVSVLEEIVKAKVSQHDDVREMLLSTGNKRLVENSPTDGFWGCGLDGQGRNEAGKILMRIRDQFQRKI